MKKITLLMAGIACLINYNAMAQGGAINTVAGCWSCIGTTVDGGPANRAVFNVLSGICQDASGNTYLSDYGDHRVRWIDGATGLIYTLVGSGVAGYSGDGAAITSAAAVQVNKPDGICIDAANNLYIADAGNNRVRKINLTTHVITTVAGGGASLADGVPATNEVLVNPRAVCADRLGNIYIGDGNKIRKINAAGIISTIAGSGAAGDSGDGGAALSAGIAGPVRYITTDAANNIYFTTNAGLRVRKINMATGIVTTVAGGGPCTQDGVPATVALLANVYSCAIDPVGNLIVADKGHRHMRIVDAITGNIYTIAGTGSSTAEGALALSAYTNPYMLYLDAAASNVYFTDSNGWGRKMAYSATAFSAVSRDSFSISIAKQCSGPVITITTNSYYGTMNMKTWFGDGQSVITHITAGCNPQGTAVVNHIYANSGTYTIKQILYNGSTALDSMRYTYQHTLCNDMKINFYRDLNTDCIRDPNEMNYKTIHTVIDSNGVPIDTVSATSGLYYTAFGSVGNVYSFHSAIPITGFSMSCPLRGVFYDTLQSRSFNVQSHDVGFNCLGLNKDLSIYAVTGYSTIFSQLYNIYVYNNNCAATDATIKVQHSNKYNIDVFAGGGISSGNFITWNLTRLPANMEGSFRYVVESAIPLPIGDTIHSKFTVSPFAGDIDTTNNTEIVIDTVKASHDPNEMAVSPPACMVPAAKTLKYTINFENTGNDTAFNIHVMDTLSDNLDPKSLNIVMASAAMDLNMIKSGGHNIVKFDFPHINLLDSSHHGQCDGAVIFTINVRNGLPAGTTITNRAGIYFDDNDVVMTNAVTNTTGCITEVATLPDPARVSIYPNPATNEVVITTEAGAYTAYTITNTLGQVVLQNNITGSSTRAGLQGIAPGVYYLSVRGGDGIKTMKFVKQ